MTLDLPRITVVTPTFNQASYIEKTIKSVLGQNYANLQYIIVDGGSRDGTKELVEHYQSSLDWWVSEADRGQSHAINKAWVRANGELVCWLNSDEVFLPGTLHTVAQHYMQMSEVGRTRAWITGHCCSYDTSGRLIRTLRANHPCHDRVGWLALGWGVPTASTFYSRRIVDACGLLNQEMHFAFDNEYALRLLFSGYRPYIIDQVLSAEVLHPECKTVASAEKFETEDGALRASYQKLLTNDENCRLSRYRQYRLLLESFDQASLFGKLTKGACLAARFPLLAARGAARRLLGIGVPEFR